MPSIKKAVMFSEHSQNYIRARAKGEDEITWSGALNEGFKALSWLSRQALPDLSPGEWEKILNVYAGTWIELTPPFRIASDIMDHWGAIEIGQLDQDWGDLVRKIHAMSQIQQYAIMDFVQIFWSHNWTQAADFESIVKQIKEMM